MDFDFLSIPSGHRHAFLAVISILLPASFVGVYLRWRHYAGGRPSKQGAEHPQLNGAPYTERRRSRRIRSMAMLELQDRYGKFISDSAHLCDISLNGASFNSSIAYKIGDTIQARLYSSREGVLQISARIVWAQTKAHPHFYRITFNSIDPVVY